MLKAGKEELGHKMRSKIGNVLEYVITLILGRTGKTPTVGKAELLNQIGILVETPGEKSSQTV